MEPGRLDATARQLASSTSRGQALKILAGSLFGTALFLKGTGRALGDNPGHPVTPAQPCKKDPDCPAGSTCANGVCRVTSTCSCDDLEARIARLEQICANGCGGSGGGGTPCTSAAGCPQPTSSCQQATCTAGVCGMTNAPVGTSCAQGVCDGNGNCVTCVSATECPQPSSTCQQATCTAGVCGTVFVTNGTACSGGVCQNGTCTSLCAGVVCNNPPANFCVSSTEANIFGGGSCDPSTGVCFYTPRTQDCTPYRCANGVCPATCSTSVDCAVGFVCSSNHCVAG
ncbi:MAG TPA: hypothetical protein VGL76_04405 [Gaiellaceae bacterium]